MKKASKIVKKDKAYIDYYQYMEMAGKIKAMTANGDIGEFLNTSPGYTRQTVWNAINGYYMRDGIKVLYKNLDVLNDFAKFIITKQKHRDKVQQEIAETLSQI